jgi:quercetin dioxygenase-like cupin family protein
LGDPCLNHLHFPAGIIQTAHTHPSTRAGIVAKGQGICVTDKQEIVLSAGSLFYIAKNTEHGFVTETSSMDVIAYHPDSDWGPTHNEHPMVNRTWVDGHKIDNLAPQHQAANFIRGR